MRRPSRHVAAVLTATIVSTVAVAGRSAGTSPRAAARRASDDAGISCSSRPATASRLHVASTVLGVSTQPFGVAPTHNGRFVFAGLSNSVGVYVRNGGRLVLRATVAVPEEALGVALTPDGRYLLAADGNGGAYVLRAAAERGQRSALLGQLESGGHGAIEVRVSREGEFAFVTLEDSDELAVFNLRRAIASRFTRYRPVGMVKLGRDPVGIAMSATGRYLYATSEVAPRSRQGSISTIAVSTAERDPARSLLTSVPAGCDPVRVAVARGSVYVTARGSDAVLWYSSRALTLDPAHALRGRVRVGSEPVGEAVVDGTRELLVADSNRFDAAPHANLALLRLTTSGRPVLEGYLRSGVFPRDIAATSNGGVAVVADYGSSQLETLSFPVK